MTASKNKTKQSITAPIILLRISPKIQSHIFTRRKTRLSLTALSSTKLITMVKLIKISLSHGIKLMSILLITSINHLRTKRYLGSLTIKALNNRGEIKVDKKRIFGMRLIFFQIKIPKMKGNLTSKNRKKIEVYTRERKMNKI